MGYTEQTLLSHQFCLLHLLLLKILSLENIFNEKCLSANKEQQRVQLHKTKSTGVIAQDTRLLSQIEIE